MELIEKSFYQVLSERAAACPDREALIRGDERVTYGGLLQRIDRIASALQANGLTPGQKVVLWGTVSVEWIAAFFGAVRAGGVAVLLNPSLTVKDAAPLVQFADTALVLFGQTHDTQGAPEEIPSLAESFGMAADRFLCLSGLDALGEGCPPAVPGDTDVRADGYVIYTSGTTAFPKAVMNSQLGLLNACLRYAAAMGDRRGDRAVLAVPLCHVYGLDCLGAYLFNGDTVVIPAAIKADAVAEAAAKEKATALLSVAVIYQGIVDNDQLSVPLAPLIRMCTIAGSYTTPVQFMRYESTLPNAVFLNLYGMTETNGGYCFTRPEDSLQVRYHTVGRPLDGLELALWDSQRGILPPGCGEIGEIVFRGITLKNSYYKLPEEKQGFDAEGWFHSGDLGTLDPEGNLTIVGRCKDIIIKGGENIAPSEVEGAALGIPGVKECRVFGYRDRVYGENLGACVTLQPGAAFDEADAKKRMRKAVGSYKSPVFYFIYDSFPLNANGKVDQRALHTDMLTRLRRLQLAEELEKGVTIAGLSVKNSTFSITPVASMLEQYAENLGFNPRKAARIRLAVEEALSLRVNETAQDVRNIDVELQCFGGYLRVTTTDACMSAEPGREEADRLSMAIILRMVDDVTTRQLDNGQYMVRMDFIYDKDFNVQDFLLHHERIG